MESKLLILLKKTAQTGTRGQSSNYVERKILELKRVWRGLFGNNNKILPSLTFSEVQLVLNYRENIVNQIPYGPSTGLCPRDLSGGDLVIPLELEMAIKQGNLKALANSLGKVKEY